MTYSQSPRRTGRPTQSSSDGLWGSSAARDSPFHDKNGSSRAQESPKRQVSVCKGITWLFLFVWILFLDVFVIRALLFGVYEFWELPYELRSILWMVDPPTKVLMQEPCPVGLPETLTRAHTVISKTRGLFWESL